MASSSTALVANDDSRLFTTFHSFPKLPKELRLMIWELLLPGPRIVDLKILRRHVRTADFLRDWDEMIGGPRPGNIKYRPEDFELPNIPPAFNQYGTPILKSHETWKVRAERGPVVLFVNQESRRVGMKVYDKTFRCVGMKSLTWFSYKQDTLYLSSEEVWKVLLLQQERGSDILGVDFSKMQRLLLGSRAYECPHGHLNYSNLCKVISWFGNLKHLTLVSETQETAVRDTLVDIPSVRDIKVLWNHYDFGYEIDQDMELNRFLTMSSLSNQSLIRRDTDGISNQRDAWGNSQKAPHNLWKWEIPTIDRQSIIAAELKADFGEAVEKYNRQKARYSIDVHLTVWGGENFQFTADQTSTVRNMIEAFRKARRYSTKRIINIEHAGKILDPQMRVLACNNLDTHTLLNVVLG